MIKKYPIVVGLVIGVLMFYSIWWLGGNDVPLERGPDAVFFYVMSFLSGAMGLLLGWACTTKEDDESGKQEGNS